MSSLTTIISSIALYYMLQLVYKHVYFLLMKAMGYSFFDFNEREIVYDDYCLTMIGTDKVHTSIVV